MSDIVSKVAEGTAEGVIKGIFEVVRDLANSLQAADKERVETLLGWIKVAQLAIEGLGKQAQGIVVQASQCDVTNSTEVKALIRRIDEYLYQDNFRPRLLDAVHAIPECVEQLRKRLDRDQNWWPFRATADKRAAVDAIEESLRTFQAFLTSLSGSGILDARSGLPIIGTIETAVKNRDASALQAAVREAFSSEQYVRWSLIAAEASASAVAISAQFC